MRDAGIEFKAINLAVTRDVGEAVALCATQPPIAGFPNVVADGIRANQALIACSILFDNAKVGEEPVLSPLAVQDTNTIWIDLGAPGVVRYA